MKNEQPDVSIATKSTSPKTSKEFDKHYLIYQTIISHRATNLLEKLIKGLDFTDTNCRSVFISTCIITYRSVKEAILPKEIYLQEVSVASATGFSYPESCFWGLDVKQPM